MRFQLRQLRGKDVECSEMHLCGMSVVCRECVTTEIQLRCCTRRDRDCMRANRLASWYEKGQALPGARLAAGMHMGSHL